MSEDCYESKVEQTITKEKLYCVKDYDVIYQDLQGCIETFFICEYIGDEIPETVEVEIYERVKVTEKFKKWLSEITVEELIERLDEEFSQSRKEYRDPDDNMIQLTRKYVEKICNMYIPYDCEKTGETIIIKTKDYL